MIIVVCPTKNGSGIRHVETPGGATTLAHLKTGLRFATHTG